MKKWAIMIIVIVVITVAIGIYYKDCQDKTEKTRQIMAVWAEEFVNGDIKKALGEYPSDAWGKRIWLSYNNGSNHMISKAPFGNIIVPFPPKKK